jgi:hypothetical protein
MANCPLGIPNFTDAISRRTILSGKSLPHEIRLGLTEVKVNLLVIL